MAGGGERADEILETMATGFFALDAQDRFTYINAHGEQILRLSRTELLGRRIWEKFPDAQHQAFGAAYRDARATGKHQLLEAWASTLQAWIEMRVVPSGDLLDVYLLDVTDRRQADERASAANDRLTLLAELALELGATLDADQAVGRLARLVVPQLADWALVTLVEDDGSLRDLGNAHRDPALEPLVSRYAALRLGALDQQSWVFRVARTGIAETVQQDAATAVSAMLPEGEARELVRQLNAQALAVLPMRARGRTVGLLTLYADQAFDRERLDTAQAVAERAGLAIDNARSYARAQAAQLAAEQATRRMQLLGDVSELLSTTLDQDVFVSELANLVVPELADWCIVSVSGRDGLERDLGWAHRDAANNDVLGDYARRQYAAMGPTAAVSVCLRTGEPVIVKDMPDTLLDGWVGDPQARAVLGRLTPGSVAVMPLKAASATLGALALVTLADRGPQTDAELHTAREVARRAGLALDNARLYAQQRQLAEALQRSLLTEPPLVPGIEVAVRYVPAAVDAQVGGDWYDAFLQSEDKMVVAIGDVIGHDSRAAAAMGQVRGLLRGIGFATGTGPAALLTRLDETIEGLQVATTATAIVVRLEEALSVLRWSNAGHPPPMLVSATGEVTVLEQPDADLLLGIDPSTPRSESVAAIGPGSTLLLYTDGLVERRGVSLDDGLDELKRALADLTGSPLEQLCDLLIGRLLPPSAEDDVALIAVRVSFSRPGRSSLGVTSRRPTGTGRPRG